MPRYDDDQDGQAAAQGYDARRRNVWESASVDERIRRQVAMTVFGELTAMMTAFEIGEPVDAIQFDLKAQQIAANMAAALELRYAAQAAKRELAGVS